MGIGRSIGGCIGRRAWTEITYVIQINGGGCSRDGEHLPIKFSDARKVIARSSRG